MAHPKGDPIDFCIEVMQNSRGLQSLEQPLPISGSLDIKEEVERYNCHRLGVRLRISEQCNLSLNCCSEVLM